METSKSQKIMNTAEKSGISAAQKMAHDMGLSLFDVDVGPGSRLEVWNREYTRKLATGSYVSKYEL
jgi:hypothetical protein